MLFMQIYDKTLTKCPSFTRHWNTSNITYFAEVRAIILHLIVACAA